MPRTPLWRARTESLTHLRRQRLELIEMVDELFHLIDETARVYEASASTNTYARICGLTLLKAKNLGLGAYSLVLDGLGQEAGALIRPFVEYTELLTYLKRFPEQAEVAASGGELPRAGARAKAIDGIYHEFREHLNEHASHSSYSHYSLSHLLEPGTFRFKTLQPMVPEVLERNVVDFSVQMYLLLHEGVLGLEPFALPALRNIGARSDHLHSRLVAYVEAARSARR